MSKSIGIVGSGLLGRLLAHQLFLEGHTVHVFDRDDEVGKLSCGWVGAGMLAPYSELDSADDQIFALGVESLKLWPELLKTLAKPVYFQRAGTLVVAHGQDRPELSRFRGSVEHKLDLLGAGHAWRAPTNTGDSYASATDTGGMPALQAIGRESLAELEPELSGRFHSGLFLPDEGQIDNRQLFNALTATLNADGVRWTCGAEIAHIEPHRIYSNGETKEFDLVLDTRGLGAKKDLPELRGVRGELIRVQANEVHLNRPVRVMHPRYPLYVVPRPENQYLIGATTIESDDDGAVTVQSALELLSAAFTIHSGFAEAKIVEMTARCRPALPDNSAKIYLDTGLLHINGLYRHGFLISPKLVNMTVALIKNNLKVDSHLEIDPKFLPIIVENTLATASR